MDVEMQRKLVYRPRAHSDPLPVWYLGLPYRYPGAREYTHLGMQIHADCMS
jgi:hypothetical protein